MDISDDSNCRDRDFGFGIPQINLAVQSLADVNGELTPLFQAHNTRGEYFYSVSPQIMISKIDSFIKYKPTGKLISETYPEYKFGISLREDRLGETMNSIPARFDFYVFSQNGSDRVPFLSSCERRSR